MAEIAAQNYKIFSYLPNKQTLFALFRAFYMAFYMTTDNLLALPIKSNTDEAGHTPK